MRYREEGVPLVALAGSGIRYRSSRDWAAKGTRLLGVRAVIAVSFERIHRSNLVGMGVLPLVFKPGENAGSLGLTGRETYSILGLETGAEEVAISAVAEDAPRRNSPLQSGWIPRKNGSITTTAASCTTCCGNSLRRLMGSDQSHAVEFEHIVKSYNDKPVIAACPWRCRSTGRWQLSARAAAANRRCCNSSTG